MGFVFRDEGSTENPKRTRVFGTQTTAGKLVYYTKKGSRTACIVNLGDGERIARGETSGEGEFEGLDWFRYDGQLLRPYDPVTAQGDYIFRPGLETDRVLQFDDPIQGRFTFFPELNWTNSGRACVELMLPEELSEGTGAPNAFQFKVRASRIQQYSNTGALLGKSFTANQARIIAFLAKFYANIPIAQRFDWPSWKTEFHDRCDFDLPWVGGAGDGLSAEYFEGNNFNTLRASRVDPIVEFNWGNTPAVSEITPGSPFTVRWTGKFEAEQSAMFTFYTFSKDGCRLWVNGAQVTNNWGTILFGAVEASGDIELVAGQKYDIVLEYMQNTPTQTGQVELWYSTPSISKRLVPKDRLFSSGTVVTNGRVIDRFDGDSVFTGVAWPDALDALMMRAPAIKWRISNGKVYFIWGPGRTKTFTLYYDPTQSLTRANIVDQTFQAARKDPFLKPNFFHVGFYDKDDDQLGYKTVRINRAELRNQGAPLRNPGTIELGVANQSLATRVGETNMRRLSDRDVDIQVRGQKDAHTIALYDLGELVHPAGDWRGTELEGHSGPIDVEVFEEKWLSGIDTANEKAFVLKIGGDDYSDTDHGPLIRNPNGDILPLTSAPPKVVSITLSEGTATANDGTVVSALNGLVQFEPRSGQRARVWVKKPSDTDYVRTPIILTPTPGTNQDVFSIFPVVAGLHLVKVVTETLTGVTSGRDLATGYPWVIAGKATGPATPTGVTAQPGTGKAIDVDWTDNTESDLQRYIVYRNTTNDPSGATAQAEVGGSRFVDIRINLGQIYHYWVVARNTSGKESAKSVSASATATGSSAIDPTPPADPSAPSLASSASYIAADGTALARFVVNLPPMPTGGALLNVLIRRITASGWDVADQRVVGGGTTTIEGLTPNVSYEIAVQALSAFNVPSNVVLATLSPFVAPNDTTAPAVPTGVTAAQGTGLSIGVDWTDATEPDFDTYGVYRATTNNAALSTLQALNPGSRFTDVLVSYGQTYFYFITAIDRSGNESAKSLFASATPTVIGGGQIDSTPPTAPSAATRTSSGTYLAGDGTALSFFRFTVPGLPAGAKLQNLLLRRQNDPQWNTVGQYDNTSQITNVPINGLTPSVIYEVATVAISFSGVMSTITLATSSPFTAPSHSGVPTAPPGTPTASMGADGTVIWVFTASSDTDIAFHQALDPTNAVVAGGERLGSTRFTEPPSAPTMQRKFRGVSRSGVVGTAGNLGTFVLPSPSNPTGTLSFDGIRLVSSITSPVEGVFYDYATANNGTGILKQNFGPVFEELTPDTSSRSITRYIRAVRFGAASAWVAISTTVNGPGAPTIDFDETTKTPFEVRLAITPPGSNFDERFIKQTIVETSTSPSFTPLQATIPFDGIARSVLISGRFSTTPTIYARVYYRDAFGNGSASASDSVTFPVIVGTEIGTAALDYTKFAASLKIPQLVTSLPALPNSQYPTFGFVVLDSVGHADHGKLFRNINNVWVKTQDGADIIANSIIGASLVAAAIGAREIAAEAIRVHHLLVGNFDNLAEDPGAEHNGTTWFLGSGMSILNSSPTAHAGNYHFQATLNDEYILNNLFADCKPGDQFYCEGWAARTGNAGGDVVIGWYNTAKALISYSVGTGGGQGGFAIYTKSTVTAAAPAGAAYARAGFKSPSSGVAGWYFDDIYMRRAIHGVIIENDTITAPKLSAESVSTRNLVVAAMSDNLLLNPSFEISASGILEAWQFLVTAGYTIQTYGAGQGSYVQIPSGKGITSKIIPVQPGEIVAIRYRAWKPSGTTGFWSGALFRSSRAAADLFISTTTISPDTVPYNSFSSFHAGINLTTDPASVYEFNFTVPAGMYWLSIYFESVSGTANVDDIMVRKQMGAAFIANASIDFLKVRELITSNFVDGVSGIKMLPNGPAQMNDGIMIKEWPLNESTGRAINSINQDGRWRGNDTGKVPISVIVSPGLSKNKIHDDSTADVVVTADIAGYFIDDTANADSMFRAKCTVLNKFGEPVKTFPDIGFFGTGVVGLGDFDRKYADPLEEATFKIQVWNGKAGYSDPIYLQGTTRYTSANLPDAKIRANCPLELAASAIDSSSVSLSWQFGSAVTVYKRQRGSTTWVSHATGVASTAPYTVTGLSELQWYEFKVSAGSGNDSNIAIAKTKQVGTAAPTFPAPSSLSGSPDGSDPTTKINITWARNATDNDGVEAYLNGSLSTTLAAGATTHQFTGLAADTNYTIKVRNKWNSGPTYSDYSNEITVRTSAGETSGSAPTDLEVFDSSIEFDYEAVLQWINHGAGGTITVERKTGLGGSWGTLQSGLSSATVTVSDMTVTPGAHGQTYGYRVKNTAVTGYSNEAFVTIYPYDGGDPYCVLMDTLVLMYSEITGERFWLPISDVEPGMIVVTVNTLTGLTNKAYVRGLRDGTTDVLMTLYAASGEVIGSSPEHQYTSLGTRDTRAVSSLAPSAPLIRLAEKDDMLAVATTVDHIEVEQLETPVATRTLLLGVLNHTFVTNGIVSHNVKP